MVTETAMEMATVMETEMAMGTETAMETETETVTETVTATTVLRSSTPSSTTYLTTIRRRVARWETTATRSATATKKRHPTVSSPMSNGPGTGKTAIPR